MNEREKAERGAATLRLFCNQFGDDVYSRILLEVLFEGIINAETLFVFGEQEQKGTEVDHRAPEPGISECSDQGSERVEPPTNLGDADWPNYP
jgi:hypothetical protein